MPDELADPDVRAFVEAVNAGDRDAFFELLAPGQRCPMTARSGTSREWVDREISSSDGRMEVDSQSEDGRSLVVSYTNSTYGTMLTNWTFIVEDGKITRFETGQA